LTRLNLTAANYVHIVEPQWNPSIEEQAIARAVRMGQTRAVTVVRYVVKNSVEEVSQAQYKGFIINLTDY
jgi:SNF2 family DNA or RNA helicase